MSKPLSEYNRKRNFSLTAEPPGETSRKKNKQPAHALSFVIQKHDARRLHYDFRLELDGTLKSWAVPKGPSLDPKDKRLAVHVEDHPISYANFEGSIPHGQYGGGDVIVWDRGVWEPHGDAADAYTSGKLKFTLIGEKLSGDWTLVRTHLRGSGDKEQWLLIKERDAAARPAEEYDITQEQPQSVLSDAVINSKQEKPRAAKLDKNASANKVTNENLSVTAKKSPQKKDEPAKESATQGKASVRTPAKKKPAKLPDLLTPELATLVSEPPAGDWLYEIKFDGYRIVARVRNGEVNLFTRNGHDWTERMPKQAKAIAAMKLGDSWLDGEVVVLNQQGLPDFQALQNAFDTGRSQDIIYYLFDAPFLNGEDLRETPVEARRAALEQILNQRQQQVLRFSAAFSAGHNSILTSACNMQLEGVIGKRMGSPYVSRRSGDWIKLKCRLRQEFLVIGYTQPRGSRSGFGALILGVHEEAGKPGIRYAGRVGTGFNEARLQDMYEKISKLHRASSPVNHKLTSEQARGVQWLEPKLVCEVEFAQWTNEGILRQAAFISLRTDKPPRDIIREQAKAPEDLPPPEESVEESPKKMSARTTTANSSVKKSSSASSEKVVTTKGANTKSKSANTKSATAKKSSTQSADLIATITHPDRVIDPESGGTKKQLAEFYLSIAKWILPHLDDRPVSIVRAPDGITGQQFFQKHAERLSIPNIHHLDPALDPGKPALMEIDNVEALVGAVQMGTVELHTWGASSTHIETPDRFTLDLDPDPALPWRSLVEATRLTLAVLDELGLDAYLKTTGGKGMHIVVPLAPKADWDRVKGFSKALAEFMARQIPERFVAKMGPQNRVGKIFIDYLRNTRGASTVCAYSVRARPGLPVSVPITRDELLELSGSSQWTIANLHERLDNLKTDPWQGYKNRQQITQAMWKKLEVNRR